MKTFREFSESFGSQPAWQTLQATERFVLPHLAIVKQLPTVELKVVAMEAIMKFIGLTLNDLRQHSNQ
jgi:hypothetical protein